MSQQQKRRIFNMQMGKRPTSAPDSVVEYSKRLQLGNPRVNLQNYY